MGLRNLTSLVFGKICGRSYILNLRPGEIVEVRSEDEIAATLDEKAALEGLLFMPMMGRYFRRRFEVLRRADKILIEGIGIRHVPNAVILKGVTCNGGIEECRRTCFPLWKEVWLKRISERTGSDQLAKRTSIASAGSDSKQTLHSKMFFCQSRRLIEAGMPISKWNIRRYMYDFTSGVYEPMEYFRTVLVSVLHRVEGILSNVTGSSSPKLRGKPKRTPTISLSLKPGDLVKVRNKREILQTLDRVGKNRGLEFTPEMEKFYGQKFQVLKKLDKMIIEQTGEMRHIANTVLLEGAFCDGKAHKGCPRHCYCLWREIWLEKVKSPSSTT
jgi:hypothetical protein